MKSIYILDTNILFYKIFSDIEIEGKRIWNDNPKYSRIKEEIDKITNAGNMIVISPTVITEAYKLWEMKLDSLFSKKRFYAFKRNEIKDQFKKRMEKLITRYKYSNKFPNLTVTERNLKEIQSVYYLFEDKLKEVTNNKISRLREDIKIRRLSYREGGYMPEDSDKKILAECMYIRQNLPEDFGDVMLFSTDSDFITFRDELKTFLFVGIHCVR